MRMARFRVRTMMVVMAIVAMLISAGRSSQTWLQRSSNRFRERAELAEMHRIEAFRYCGRPTRVWVTSCSGPILPPHQPNLRRAEHHARLYHRWAWAANHPWIPMWSDPPEPN